MSKKYVDVKRAAEAALKGLIRAINDNLTVKEANQLYMELSMTIFTASLNFDLPLEEFDRNLSEKQTRFLFQTSEETAAIKHAIDNGEDYDAEDL